MDTATQDLVTRLSEAKNYIYHPRSQSVEDAAMRAIDDAIAALAAAPPADLVALVLEWQAAEVAWDGSGRSAKRQNDAYHALISWRPSAPPEPHHEAPQGTK